jgi:type II secretion system protein G
MSRNVNQLGMAIKELSMSMRKNKRNARRRPAPGFTMIEMMLVVAIIGILMGAAVWSMAGNSDRARKRTTEATMRTVQTALNAYKADKGNYPANLQVLVTEKYFDKVYKDSWKQDLIYSSQSSAGKPFSLVSAGADQQMGTDDDIDVWRIDEETPTGN